MTKINLICTDCGNEFFFSDKEQEFYKEKGFKNPKRCFSCRQAKKNEKANVGGESHEHHDRPRHRRGEDAEMMGSEAMA